ncbi:MAG: transcriptional repressor LexA [Ruminococcaceae bacterium]|nr:transcriptional repressor LexA [Oscillospiraceae bacterium]
MAANIDKQQQILNFIEKQVLEKGYPPTVREICDAVGLNSPATVHGYLKRLEKNGHIIKENGSSRGIRLKNVPTNISSIDKEYLEVPVIGRVSAGMPILAEENLERTFPLPMDFAKKNDVYMLRVRGESMINAGILDGDYVIVEKCEVARNGEMVVALVDDSATVKTFYKEDGHFRLQPENDFMEPIIVDSVSILGKVVGVYRLF